MSENIRQAFLETWEEISRELIRHPELEENMKALAETQELICEGSLHIPAKEVLLLVAQWLTKVLDIPTTFDYDKDAYERKTQELKDSLGDGGEDLVGDLFKGVKGIDDD